MKYDLNWQFHLSHRHPSNSVLATLLYGCLLLGKNLVADFCGPNNVHESHRQKFFSPNEFISLHSYGKIINFIFAAIFLAFNQLISAINRYKISIFIEFNFIIAI